MVVTTRLDNGILQDCVPGIREKCGYLEPQAAPPARNVKKADESLERRRDGLRKENPFPRSIIPSAFGIPPATGSRTIP